MSNKIYEKEATVIDNTIYDLINESFKKERETNNSKYRLNLFKNHKDYFVKTDDGSYSIKSKKINNKIETLHTQTGAISESFEKFIKPMKIDYTEDIKILDICAGLGYNSSATISDFLTNGNEDINLEIDMVEISKATLACGLLVPSPIPSHNITKKAIEEELIKEDYAKLNLEKSTIPDNIKINVFIEDGRKTIQKLKKNNYDGIFLDPFSQNMAPELFSTDFFSEFYRVIKDNGIVATYTSSAPVRNGFIEAGFHIGLGPIFGRFQGGTLASKNPDYIDKALDINDEKRIALSDVKIPFRDPNLNLTSKEIIENRTLERSENRHKTCISSAVKTPIYLNFKMKDEKLKRRVERNLKKVNIPSTISPEAEYIVELENEYQENSSSKSNSRMRILEMASRLNEVINGKFLDK